MDKQAGERLSEIQAMLAAGHHSVHLERHTLVLWGITGGVLAASVDVILSAARMPIYWQRGIAQSLLIAGLLLVVGLLDQRLTRAARRRRDETLSFTQRQLQKLWWFLILLGTGLTFGTYFFGGGYMVYGIWMVLTGLMLVSYGLFSRQMLTWAGGLLTIAAIAGTALMPVTSLKWFTAGVFGFGLPLLGWMVGRPDHLRSRLGYTALWLTVVAATAWGAARLGNPPPVSPADANVVHLAAGSTVPLTIRLQGDLIRGTAEGTLPIVLDRDLDVVVENGRGDGRYRVDGAWRTLENRLRVTRVDRALAVTPGQGARAEAAITIEALP